MFKLGTLCAWGWLYIGVLLLAPSIVQAHAPQAMLPTLRQIALMSPPDSAATSGQSDSAAVPTDAELVANVDNVVGFTEEAALTLTDSLLQEVSKLRQLRALHGVPVGVADRSQIRARLDEIIQEEGVEATVRLEERIFKHLGLVPRDTDLLHLYKDLLEEQLAGFYDIDRRELILARWLPLDLQEMVAAHELTHALQDQHFSLRVRKKLGFENRDAEAAWQALVEGDANAVMLDLVEGASGRGFAAFADSGLSPDLDVDSRSSTQSEIFLGAPSALRDFLSFPYYSGLRFVASLHEAGGWQRVDDAFVRPPTSTEQILHPERFLVEIDEPVRIEQPSIHGILADGYKRTAEMRLGEEDIRIFLKQYLDPEMAAIAAAGWGGCKVSLYESTLELPDVLAMSSVWDSEDDALEIFGALIGTLEMRYPEQTGWGELTNENQIVWSLEEDRKHVNILQLSGRQVTLLEQVPADRYPRVLLKLERSTRMHDPTPDLRTARKDDLVWSRDAAADFDSTLILQVALPTGWSSLEAASDATPVDPNEILAAERPGGSLQVLVDHEIQDPLGVGGFAHTMAVELQARGRNVYIQSDVNISRNGMDLYELVFRQLEANQLVVYYLAVIDLKRGYGCVVMREAGEGPTYNLRPDFDEVLQTLAVVPPEDASPQPLDTLFRNVGGQ